MPRPDDNAKCALRRSGRCSNGAGHRSACDPEATLRRLAGYIASVGYVGDDEGTSQPSTLTCFEFEAPSFFADMRS